MSLSTDLAGVWSAPTTSDRDREELLRALIEQVVIGVGRDKKQAHLTLLRRGSLISEVDVALPRSQPPPIRTDEQTVDLVHRLAIQYPEAVIAGILNRQGRTTTTGNRFMTNRVCSLRTHRHIPRFQTPSEPVAGELATIQKSSEILGLAPSTVHLWLNEGFIAGEQLTPAAPWRIRITDELRARFVEQPPQGYVPMIEGTRLLGVFRQTVLQRVKRGEYRAVHLRSARRKGLRIQGQASLPGLCEQPSTDGCVV